EASRIVDTDPDRLRARLDRTMHTAGHVAVGQRVKAWDRRNIGTVEAVDDTAGSVQVRFVSAEGRTALRTLDWGDVAIVTPRGPEPRAVTAEAEASLGRLTDELAATLAAWE